jgi:hypothetical protein
MDALGHFQEYFSYIVMVSFIAGRPPDWICTQEKITSTSS